VIDEILEDVESRMSKTIDALANALKKVRTGRAHPSLLDSIKVDYYGSPTQLNQVANISVEDGRTLTVSPWEKDMVPDVEKAIMASDLGLNPSTAGTVIRLPMPALTEETRRDLVKTVKSEGENSKVALRNIRREANSDFKDLLKEKEISEDEDRKAQDDVQKLTDQFIAQVDQQLATKESELMEV
jgi:ribosome recycling factor